MKMGLRSPSPKRSISARTTGKLKRAVKRSVNPLYQEKGMGYINDPEKALYNKVYNKTSTGLTEELEQAKSHANDGCRMEIDEETLSDNNSTSEMSFKEKIKDYNESLSFAATCWTFFPLTLAGLFCFIAGFIVWGLIILAILFLISFVIYKLKE